MIYAYWYGGSSYVVGELDEYLEQFPGLNDAIEAFVERERNGSWLRQDFHFVNKPMEAVFVPAVDESCSMYIYFENPEGVDPYPDKIIRLKNGKAVIEDV